MASIPKAGSVSFEDRVTKASPFEWGYGSTPRTARLREELYSKAAVIKDFINVFMGHGKMEFRKGIRVDVDRARIVTEAFMETEGQPRVLRFARMMEKLCEEMPIFIKQGELIVGDPNGAPNKARWYPETNVEWVPDAVTTGGFSEMVTEDERKVILEDICGYWKDKSVAARIKASLPKEMVPEICTYGASILNIWEEGRIAPAYNWEVLFREGLRSRIEFAEAKLRELDSRVADMHPAEYLEKRYNWEAMARCGRAIIRYAERLAELARQQALAEKEPARKKELEEMADILKWVPANPPRTIHECLQFYWIVEVTAHYMARWGNGAGTRIDQVWWPFYEADMRAGRITRDKAVELVECLFIKIEELGAALEWPVSFTGSSGAHTMYTANICGSTPDGTDASNDLSCVIMEALSNVRLSQPPIALRYHRNISPDVVERAIDLGRIGLGHPSYFNEDLLERWGLMRGWPLEDAKRTQATGCVVNNVMGKMVAGTGLGELGGFNMLLALQEVLYQNDQEARSGCIVLPAGKNATEMKSADELLEALLDRILYYSRLGAVSWNIAQQVIMDYRPDPCNSLLMDDSLRRGIDMMKVHKESDTWPNVIPGAMINVSDCLGAIQKLVFDEKKYTMQELLTALRANWEGHEEMRQDFLNAPKFGNDDDFADDWAVKLHVRMEETMNRIKDAWGYTATIDGSVAGANVIYGLQCGATPDGRMALDPCADGTRSPLAGFDKKGPTAVLNSAGKIPFLHTELVNQRFMPQFLEGDNKKLFAEYLREWYEQGTIPHVQFNVVGGGELRRAQEEPERHSELIVRVAGYSAHFVDLPKVYQDSIIARTEQCLG